MHSGSQIFEPQKGRHLQHFSTNPRHRRSILMRSDQTRSLPVTRQNEPTVCARCRPWSITESEGRQKPYAAAACEIADSVPMLSVAVPLLAALGLPGSAHRRVSERTIGSRQMSMPHTGVREGRPNLKEPASTNVACPPQEMPPPLVQPGLRAITTSVSPGQSQKMPSAERFASSARTSPAKSSRRSPNRCGAEDEREK